MARHNLAIWGARKESAMTTIVRPCDFDENAAEGVKLGNAKEERVARRGRPATSVCRRAAFQVKTFGTLCNTTPLLALHFVWWHQAARMKVNLCNISACERLHGVCIPGHACSCHDVKISRHS